MHGTQYFLNVRHCDLDAFGCFGAVGLVFRKIFMAKRIRTAYIKNDRQMRWFFTLQYIEQRIHESHDGRGIQPFGIDAWIFDKCIISSENQGISIE